MDEVIVSTAFNKMQSQNDVKVETKYQNLQTKSHFNRILATIPGVSQGFHRKPLLDQ
jgi:iron complex outermembrane receptor protein